MIIAELTILLTQLYIFDKFYKNRINIISINLLLWIFLIILCRYYFGSDFFGEFYIIIGVTIFNCFHILGKELSLTNQMKRTSEWISYDKEKLFTLIKILTLFEIARLYLTYKEVMSIAKSLSFFLESNTAVRNQYLVRHTPFYMKIIMNLVNYFVYIGFILIALYKGQEYGKKERKRRKFIFLFWGIAEVLVGLITMSKMGIVACFLIFFFPFYYAIGERKKRRHFITKSIPFVIVLFSAFFILIGIQRHYADDFSSLVQIVTEKAVYYLISPIKAFFQIVRKPELNSESGSVVFNFSSKIFKIIGLWPKTETVGNHLNFIHVGNGMTNVYTAFGIFYFDYGIIGIFFESLFFGFCSGFLLGKETNSVYSLSLFGSYSMGVFMSFYTYMHGQTIYLMFPFFAYIIEKYYLKSRIRVVN